MAGRPRKIEKKNGMESIQLSNYVPIVPNISKTGSDYIKFSRDIDARDDSMFEYLLELSNGYSPTHTGILNLTGKMIVGDGFIPVNGDDQATQTWLQQANPYESWDDILEKIAREWAIFNTYCIQVVWSKDGKKPINFYSIPVHQVRAGEANEFGMVTHYYLKNNWLSNNRYYNQSMLVNYSSPSEKPICLPAFDPAKGATEPVQILYVRKPDNSQPYYTIPDYFSAQDYFLIEKNLGVLNSASLQNGFLPNLFISMNGSPTDEERTMILNKLRESFQGSKNAGKAWVEFIENETQSMKIQPVDVPNNADLYSALVEISIGAISRAHSCQPEIGGLVTSSASLGGDSNKLSVAYQLFYQNVIVGMQKNILKGINKLTKAAGVGEVSILNEHPLFLVDKDLLKSVLTSDEIREYIGFEPLQAGQQAVAPNPSAPVAGQPAAPVQQGNDFLSSLSGTQYRQLMRILREYNKEKISEAVATMMLQTSFGFTAEQISTLLTGE